MKIETTTTAWSLNLTVVYPSGVVEKISFAKGDVFGLKAFLKLRGLTK